MSLELPGFLAPVALFLGPPFPDGKEDIVLSMGDAHEAHAPRMKEHITEGNRHAQRVVSANRSDGVTAFEQNISQPDGAQSNMMDATTGTRVIGVGLKASGGIILAHKGVTLFQYGITAAAIAEAFAAGGIGGALTPLIREAGQRALDQGMNVAVDAVMS